MALGRFRRRNPAQYYSRHSGYPDAGISDAPREADPIVAYLRSLGNTAGENIEGRSRRGPHAVLRIGRVQPMPHVRRTGRPAGARLEFAGRERKADRQSAESDLNPDESLRRNYETVEVRLADGRILRGVTKNEDTFSIQIMDEKEKLHMLLKSDLKEIDTRINRSCPRRT